MLLIKNCMIISDNNNLKTVDILIKDNKIVSIGKEDLEVEECEVIDCSDKIAIPGLINSHTHSYSNIFKGAGEKLPLEIWMYYAYLSGILDEEAIYYSVMLGVIESIKSGVTTCIDHLGVGYDLLKRAIDAYKEVGFRAIVSPMVTDKKYMDTLPLGTMDMGEEVFHNYNTSQCNTARDVSEFVEKVINDFHTRDGLIQIMPGPSGPQRCTDELLINLNELSNKYDLGIHTHLLETKIQAVTAYEQYGRSMVEHLEKIGVLSDRWSMAHSVWTSDKEIDILRNYNVSVAHNPISNLYLGSGIAPIIRYNKNNINIGLGTDGSNCGGTQNIFSAMNVAPILSHVTTPEFENWIGSDDIFKMVTENGAKIIRRQDLGELKVGNTADITLLNANSDYLTPSMDFIHQLVYCERGESVDTVIIDGKVVMRNRELTTINEENILQKSNEIFESMRDNITSKIKNSEIEMRFVSEVFKNNINCDIGYHRSGYWNQ